MIYSNFSGDPAIWDGRFPKMVICNSKRQRIKAVRKKKIENSDH